MAISLDMSFEACAPSSDSPSSEPLPDTATAQGEDARIDRYAAMLVLAAVLLVGAAAAVRTRASTARNPQPNQFRL